MNLKELKELIEMLKNTDISELEIERSGAKVRIRKGGDVTFHPAMPRMGIRPRPLWLRRSWSRESRRRKRPPSP